MKYTDNFHPMKGDRVLIKNYTDSTKCRVISVGEETLTVKNLIHGYFERNIKDVSFLYECPWYLFWQKY